MAVKSLLPLLSIPLLALANPLPPPVTTESGNGPAPWAGQAPLPSTPISNARVQPAALAAADSSVPFGQVISACTVPGTVALTFDDGPYIYTASILDTLRDAGIHATFFVNGDNWAQILNNGPLVQRTLAEGHQIGSHTWSHADLATLPKDGIESQMSQLEDALIQLTGQYPAYMRPPYLSTNQLALDTLAELGYHVISANIDTLDWNNDSEGAIGTAVQNFKTGLDQGGSIELSHDVHEWTARVLVGEMIKEVKSRELTAVTVGECLGDAKENWYRTR